MWVPISLLAGAVGVARFVVGLIRRDTGRPLAVWSVLRSRRYNDAVAAQVLTAASEDPLPPKPPVRGVVSPRVSRADGSPTAPAERAVGRRSAPTSGGGRLGHAAREPHGVW